MEDKLSTLRSDALLWQRRQLSDQDLLQLAEPLWQPPKENKLALLLLIKEEQLRPLSPIMSRALRERNEDIQSAALYCIATCVVRELADEVASLLRNSTKRVQFAALHALAQLQTPKIIEKIKPVTKSEDEELRATAIHTIGRLCTAENEKLITNALQDSSALVQRFAIAAFVLMEHHAKASLLVKFLRKRETCKDAERALHRLYDPEAIPALERIAAGDDEESKQAAANILTVWSRKTPQPKTETPTSAALLDLEACEALALDEGAATRTRTNALRELGHLRDPGLADFISSFLTHKEEELRMHAAFALRDTAPRLKAKELLACLSDPSDECRWAALCAIQETYQLEELPKIASMISDESEQVRSQVCEIIGAWRATQYAPLLREWLREDDAEAPLEALVRLEDQSCHEELIETIKKKEIFWSRYAISAAGDLAIKESAIFLRAKAWDGNEDAMIALAKLGALFADLRGEIIEEYQEIYAYRGLSQKAGRLALLGLIWMGAASDGEIVALLKWLQDPAHEGGYFYQKALIESLFQRYHPELHQRLQRKIPTGAPQNKEELYHLFRENKISLIAEDLDWVGRRYACPEIRLHWLVEDFFYPNNKFAEGDTLYLLSEEEALSRWEKHLA